MISNQTLYSTTLLYDNAVFTVNIATRDANRMEHISFKSGCAVRMVKHLKRDWLIVFHLQLYL